MPLDYPLGPTFRLYFQPFDPLSLTHYVEAYSPITLFS
jgi:hypothetical protein